MLRQSTLIFPAFQQGQAPQEDIQKKNSVCMYVCICMWYEYDIGEDGEMGSDVIVLLVYFLKVNKNLKSSWPSCEII